MFGHFQFFCGSILVFSYSSSSKGGGKVQPAQMQENYRKPKNGGVESCLISAKLQYSEYWTFFQAHKILSGKASW